MEEDDDLLGLSVIKASRIADRAAGIITLGMNRFQSDAEHVRYAEGSA